MERIINETKNTFSDKRNIISDEKKILSAPPFQKTDVLVVGITTGGLLLSLDLTNKNVKNVVINKYENYEKYVKSDKNYIPNLSDDERNEQFLLHPKTLEILQDLKLLSKISSKGIKLNGISFYVENKLVNSTNKKFLQNCNNAFPYILSISKYTLNNILKKELKSIGGIIKEDTFLWNVSHKYEKNQQEYTCRKKEEEEEEEEREKDEERNKERKGYESIRNTENEKKRERTTEKNRPENNYNFNRISDTHQTILQNEKQKKSFLHFPNFISENNISFNPFCINNRCNVSHNTNISKVKTMKNDNTLKKIYTKPSLLKNREQMDICNSKNSVHDNMLLLQNGNNNDELYYQYSSSTTNEKTTNDSVHSNTSGTIYSMTSSNSAVTSSNSFSSSCSSNFSANSFLSSLNYFSNQKKTYEAIYNEKKKVGFSNRSSIEKMEQKKFTLPPAEYTFYPSKQDTQNHISMGTLDSFPKIRNYNEETEKRKYIQLSADFSSSTDILSNKKTVERQGKNKNKNNGNENCNVRDEYYYTGVHVKQKVPMGNGTESTCHNIIKTKYIVGVEGRKSAVRKFAHISLEKKESNLYEYISVDLCVNWKQKMNPHNVSLISSELGFITCFPILVEYDHINENNIFFISEEAKENIKMMMKRSNHLKSANYSTATSLKKNNTKYYDTCESEKDTSNFASCEYDDKEQEQEQEQQKQEQEQEQQKQEQEQKQQQEQEQQLQQQQLQQKQKLEEKETNKKIKETKNFLNKTSTLGSVAACNEIEKVKKKYKKKTSEEDNTPNGKEEKLLKYKSLIHYTHTQQNNSIHMNTEEQNELNLTESNLEVEVKFKETAKNKTLEDKAEEKIEGTKVHNENIYIRNIRRNYSDPTQYFVNFKEAFQMNKGKSKNFFKSMTISDQKKVNLNSIGKKEINSTEEKENEKGSKKKNNTVENEEQHKHENEAIKRTENEYKDDKQKNNFFPTYEKIILSEKNEQRHKNVENEKTSSSITVMLHDKEKKESEETEEYTPLSSEETQNAYAPISKNEGTISNVNKSIVYAINRSIGCSAFFEKTLKNENSNKKTNNPLIEYDKKSTQSFNENFVDALSNISTEEINSEFDTDENVDGYNWHLTICRKVKVKDAVISNLKENMKEGKLKISETKLKKMEKKRSESEEYIQNEYLQKDRFIMNNEYQYLYVMRLIKNIFPNSEVYYLYNLHINVHEDKICKNYFNNCMILAGESNCFYNPIFHLSTNLEIQDVYNIGWKLKYLIHQKASLLLLETYEKERKCISETMLQWNEKQLQFLLNTSLFSVSFLNCCVSVFSNISNITNPFEEFYVKSFMLQDEENYLPSSFGFTKAISTAALCTLTQPQTVHLREPVLCKNRARNCVLKHIHSSNNYEEKTVSLYDFLRSNNSAHTLILCINTSHERSMCCATNELLVEANQESNKNSVHWNTNGGAFRNFFKSTNHPFSSKPNHKGNNYDIKSFERLSKIGRLANSIMKKNTPFCSPLNILWIICDSERKILNMNNNVSLWDEYTSTAYCPFYHNINLYKIPGELLKNINSKTLHPIILYDFISDFQKQFRVKLSLPNNFFEQKNLKSAAYIFVRPDLSISHFNYVNDENDITCFLDYLYRLYT